MITSTVLLIVLQILAIHWFSDFFLQTSWQADNKSKRIDALTYHVFTYSVMTTALWGITFGLPYIPALYLFFITFFAHWGTDFVTSRIVSPLFKKKEYHWGFVAIGVDQVLHYIQLFLTAKFLHI